MSPQDSQDRLEQVLELVGHPSLFLDFHRLFLLNRKDRKRLGRNLAIVKDI